MARFLFLVSSIVSLPSNCRIQWCHFCGLCLFHCSKLTMEHIIIHLISFAWPLAELNCSRWNPIRWLRQRINSWLSNWSKMRHTHSIAQFTAGCSTNYQFAVYHYKQSRLIPSGIQLNCLFFFFVSILNNRNHNSTFEFLCLNDHSNGLFCISPAIRCVLQLKFFWPGIDPSMLNNQWSTLA